MVAAECEALGAGDDVANPVDGAAVVVVAAVVEVAEVEGWKEGVPVTSAWPSSLRLLVPRVVLSFKLSLFA